MQIVSSGEIQWTAIDGVRDGEIRFKRLIQGEPDALDNVEFLLVLSAQEDSEIYTIKLPQFSQ